MFWTSYAIKSFKLQSFSRLSLGVFVDLYVFLLLYNVKWELSNEIQDIWFRLLDTLWSLTAGIQLLDSFWNYFFFHLSNETIQLKVLLNIWQIQHFFFISRYILFIFAWNILTHEEMWNKVTEKFARIIWSIILEYEINQNVCRLRLIYAIIQRII